MLISRFILPLIGASFAAGTAMAGSCVSSANMGQGILAEYADGTLTEVRRADDGLVEVTELAVEEIGGDMRYTAKWGLYDLAVEALKDGKASPDHRVDYRYDGDPLPQPQPGGLPWVGTVAATFPGDEVSTEQAAYVFGAEARVELDGCSYRSFPINVTFTQGYEWESQTFLYFPDLGFAMLIENSGMMNIKERQELVRLTAKAG
ncbi:MAG: hypothetical protein WBA91_11855 [Paracoccaceae bacterium]